MFFYAHIIFNVRTHIHSSSKSVHSTIYLASLTSQASHLTCLWAYANLGVKTGHPRTSLGHAGLSDCNTMLIAQGNCNSCILWQCTLSERQLWLLAVRDIKQFIVPLRPGIPDELPCMLEISS